MDNEDSGQTVDKENAQQDFLSHLSCTFCPDSIISQKDSQLRNMPFTNLGGTSNPKFDELAEKSLTKNTYVGLAIIIKLGTNFQACPGGKL